MLIKEHSPGIDICGGEEQEAGTGRGRNCISMPAQGQPQLTRWAALESEQPFRIALVWTKMCRALYSLLDQSLNVCILRRGTTLSEVTIADLTGQRAFPAAGVGTLALKGNLGRAPLCPA